MGSKIKAYQRLILSADSLGGNSEGMKVFSAAKKENPSSAICRSQEMKVTFVCVWCRAAEINILKSEEHVLRA